MRCVAMVVRRKAPPPCAAKSLCRALLELLLPLPERCQAVHPRAMRERALRGRDVLVLAGPGLLGRRLQRAAVRERELPGPVIDLVHGVEMAVSLLLPLAPAQQP